MAEVDGRSDRTRLVQWPDPRIAAEAVRRLSGLEYFQKVIAGELPLAAIGALLDFELVEVSAGRVVFVGRPAEWHYNPLGTVHGGFAATLLDSATACAIHSALPQGTSYTTIELKVNYIRPLTVATGPVRCIGEIIHVGRRMATSAAKVVDAAGKLYAHGSCTCMVLPAEA